MSLPTRRAFVQSSAALAAVGLWRPLPLLRAEEGADAEAKPRFRFAQINDLHVQAPLPADGSLNSFATYHQANEKAVWAIEEVNRQQPDFVLAIGDMTHGGRLDRLAPDMKEFQEIAKPLKAPLFPAVGNHEVVQQEGNPTYEQVYRDTFGDERVNYFFERDGLLFIMLNNSGACVVGPDVVKKRNAWLAGVLRDHPRQKKIIGCHIPIVPVRDEPVLAKSFGFRSYQAHDAELLAMVDEHAESIAAVLSGHLHLTGCVERNGVWHISICGTASYPSDIARFDVYENHIDLRAIQLPQPLATSHPSIHGQPRHKTLFTDEHHATAEQYMLGTEQERRLRIPLG